MSVTALRRVLVLLLVVAAIAAATTAVAGAVLAEIYRSGPAFSEVSDRPPAVVRSDAWMRRHEIAAGALAVSSAVASAASLLAAPRGAPTRQAVLVIAGPVLALGAAVLTIVTRAAVAFDQVALTAVTAGMDLSGYWFAAFDEEVRFVILDGTEVDQGAYAVGLLVHLGAPVVGLALLVPAVAVARRLRPGPASSPDDMAPPGPG